jgi:hypothetical protein
MSGVLRYLVKVLLSGSLGLGPLLIKRSTDLGKGLLGDPHLLLPRDEDLFPLGELPLLGKEFLDCHGQRCHHRASGNIPTHNYEWPNPYLLKVCVK